MNETHHYITTVRKLPRTLFAAAILALAYIILGVSLPPNTPTVTAYHLSTGEYHVLTLLVSIPLIAVWFATFYGYARLQEYVSLVGKAPDGPPLGKIATGLGVLAWGLPLSSIITSIFGGIVHAHVGLAGAAFIILHYLSLLISLIAFSYISIGSRGLVKLTTTQSSLTATRWLMLSMTTIGVLFSYVVIKAADVPGTNPFYLPLWLVLFTILIPYLFAWFMGFIAAYELYLYSRRAKGLLYRRAFVYLAVGTLITILTAIAFQYLQSDSTHLRKITFNWLFLGVYTLLVIYAGGYLLISAGVRKLRKIEEV